MKNLKNNIRNMWRKPAFFTAMIFVLALCTLSIVSTASKAKEDSFSEAQKEEMQILVRDYLVSHPEVIVEAMDAYQQNQEDVQKRLFETRISKYKDSFYGDDVPFVGNPDADVVIVEFFDYNCGYCKKAFNDVQALVKQDKNLKIVFVDMPILSADSKKAAQWSLAAHSQGKYFEYHVALMKFAGRKSQAAYEKIGEDLGLDIEKLRKDSKDSKTLKIIADNLAMTRELGIRGTPAFIIDDTLAPGYMGLDRMKDAIEQARKDRS